MCIGVELAKQNSITQQILAQYLQKRLIRAGGSVPVAGQQQLSDLPTPGGGGVQKNSGENLYAAEEDDVDIVGDANYYQGQTLKS